MPAQQPTCLCCVAQILAHPRVLPQLPAAQVEYPGAHGILQSPVQAAGRVVLLLVLVLAEARGPGRSAGVVMALKSRDSSHTSLTRRHFRKKEITLTIIRAHSGSISAHAHTGFIPWTDARGWASEVVLLVMMMMMMELVMVSMV